MAYKCNYITFRQIRWCRSEGDGYVDSVMNIRAMERPLAKTIHRFMSLKKARAIGKANKQALLIGGKINVFCG